MPRTARKSAPTRSSPAPPPPSIDRDLAESGGGWFEEASDHEVARPAHRFLHLGPVVPIAPAALVPGIYGWYRPMQGPERGPGSDAVLYYLIGHAEPDTKGPSPLKEIDWAEYVAIELCTRPAPGFVLVRGPASAKAEYQRFVADVRAEIANLDD